MSRRFDGKVAVVTGGGKGIGLAVSRRFAAEGAKVVLSGRDQAALEAAIAPYKDGRGWHWQHGDPSLEDVFIDLMSRSKDNFQ